MLRHELLKNLHELLKPRTYFEIGVNYGSSLTLSRTRTVAVDPFYKVTREVQCDVHLVRATSDEFFARKHPLAHFDEPVIDLAFIDGMHLSEYAFRDFINTERFTHAGSVIVIDDMLPRNDTEAARDRDGAGLAGKEWTGDVYKITGTLRELRPDLVCLEVDTQPTGTVVILLPDPASDTLHTGYDDIVEEYVSPDPQTVPEEVLRRSQAIAPEALIKAPIWDELRAVRTLPDAQGRARARTAIERAGLLSARA
ncbi:MAG: class I SAM-dependent methyltransferase [Nocardioides sp.]